MIKILYVQGTPLREFVELCLCNVLHFGKQLVLTLVHPLAIYMIVVDGTQ